VSDIVRIVTNPRRGRALIYNGVLYVGGQAADDRRLDARGQTAQALAKLDKVLAEAGTDKSRLLTAQIWLKDIADFAAMNDAWDAWVDVATAPARATAQCELAAPDALVEIIVTAAVGGHA
jgi:enamine deaminase RidA (YjgF/YER057c/UK114 family)